MSWSISALGKPAGVKSALAVQFAAAKRGCAHIQAEVDTVTAIEALVNAQLDFLWAGSAVRVEGSGSAYDPPEHANRSCYVTFSVQPVYNFVE